MFGISVMAELIKLYTCYIFKRRRKKNELRYKQDIHLDELHFVYLAL